MRRLLTGSLVGPLLAALGASAFAQAPPPQRPGGLFATKLADPGGRQNLDLTMTSTGGYDTSATPEGAAGAPSVGYSSMLVGNAEYTLQSRHTQLRATGTSAHYFRPLDNSAFGSGTHAGAVGFSARSRRNTLIVNQTAMYSSWPLENLFARPAGVTPGDAPAAAPDYVNNSKSYSYGTALIVMRTVTQK